MPHINTHTQETYILSTNNNTETTVKVKDIAITIYNRFLYILFKKTQLKNVHQLVLGYLKSSGKLLTHGLSLFCFDVYSWYHASMIRYSSFMTFSAILIDDCLNQRCLLLMCLISKWLVNYFYSSFLINALYNFEKKFPRIKWKHFFAKPFLPKFCLNFINKIKSITLNTRSPLLFFHLRFPLYLWSQLRIRPPVYSMCTLPVISP